MSKYKEYYQRRKAQLVAQAIDLQMRCSDGEVMYWSDIAEAGDYFRYWGKRFGLLREFREMYEYERGHIVDIEHGGCGEYCYPGIYFRAHYIGDGAELTLTRKKPVEHGWHPYE